MDIKHVYTSHKIHLLVKFFEKDEVSDNLYFDMIGASVMKELMSKITNLPSCFCFTLLNQSMASFSFFH